MDIFHGLTFTTGVFLIVALGLALGFEFVNGFHDTANAVATVIYTNTLRPKYAVVLSGVMNLLGVLTSSGAVAYTIVSLLPVELVINSGSSRGFAMVFSLLISAIIWNLGTWYLGLPASSSHTLIGSIMGVGLANSLLTPGQVFGEGVNWGKVTEVFESLLFSPLIGFFAAGLLLFIAKQFLKRPELYKAPEGKEAPPLWIRVLLIFTCTSVSFAHGSNDGQKGMGIIMLILVGILPATFSLNPALETQAISIIVQDSQSAAIVVNKFAAIPSSSLNQNQARDQISAFLKTSSKEKPPEVYPALANRISSIATQLTGKNSFESIAPEQRSTVRTDMYLVSGAITKMKKAHALPDNSELTKPLLSLQKEIDKATKYIPNWVKVAVAFALGLGAMIGWKRIVVTVGEKIGKEHLTYAQGAAAELVAAGTISAADILGLPVSTTHVLSSGVAGTMAANGSGLQKDTVKNILLAWILTLPVCVLLGSALFAAGFYLVTSVLGL